MSAPFQPGPRPAPPGLPPGAGLLRFTVSGSVLTNSLAAPTVTVNGHFIAAPTSGSVDLVLPAGVHHVHAHSQWMRRYGDADLQVDLRPGQAVEVFYAAPAHQFAARGNIGLTPQKKAGMAALIAFLVAAVVLTIVASVALILL